MATGVVSTVTVSLRPAIFIVDVNRHVAACLNEHVALDDSRETAELGGECVSARIDVVEQIAALGPCLFA